MDLFLRVFSLNLLYEIFLLIIFLRLLSVVWSRVLILALDIFLEIPEVLEKVY